MIEVGLFQFLSAETSVASLVGDGDRARIFPLIIPQKKPGGAQQIPCYVYAVTGDNRGRGYCGSDKLVQKIVAIDSYAATMKVARQLSDILRAAILDYRGMMGEVVVRDISLVSSIVLSDMEPGLIRVSDVFSIWHEEE